MGESIERIQNTMLHKLRFLEQEHGGYREAWCGMDEDSVGAIMIPFRKWRELSHTDIRCESCVDAIRDFYRRARNDDTFEPDEDM